MNISMILFREALHHALRDARGEPRPRPRPGYFIPAL